MSSKPNLTPYLGGYSESLREQIGRSISDGKLGAHFLAKYPALHQVRNERALQVYVADLKNSHLRSAPPLSKVCYDNQIHVIRNALGTHTTISRVQGLKLKTKREIRIATMFRSMPEAFLKMIVVHELAHMRISEHDKAFYQLCCHMEPAYHQYEFDLRAYLSWRAAGGADPWQPLTSEDAQIKA
ncbi:MULTISPECIES: YgjP-like metallopeptidase domain-containing protein [unclassified Undibacterium]|uniref:YgjP-like metallopeptidase domain-containing protein n=1 Tax=unclassified Undibacterium TaxID=2630295 RepID=UPI002AC8E6E2|nr:MULTISPECIES: YgjP-like metallopeptidase domain-containing protein [unclassified Undibacterium]MEB0140721.1 DUF45 domain-containing protein [Undibacterium sp. CCC2.1]MEB0173744.1 DUF45 domain-containing protein [Undibacterium sp. CCC1.1]MEB0178056.1 DUF45 domain-containing protein [Undibacterium sp. CCC3.4]MEB0216906.1 DUF45 domain-containing protein [Undibacterium sp. 5I2]WPX41972.1 DUF45 domain-containing protein [Undibacterium sp. CCC3.4]